MLTKFYLAASVGLILCSALLIEAVPRAPFTDEPPVWCPEGSEWKEGNQCAELCGDNICPASVEWGCFCSPGFNRIEGDCVPKEFCDCGENRWFNSCANPCDHQCPYDGMACPGICLRECSCVSGLIDVDGECRSRTTVCNSNH